MEYAEAIFYAVFKARERARTRRLRRFERALDKDIIKDFKKQRQSVIGEVKKLLDKKGFAYKRKVADGDIEQMLNAIDDEKMIEDIKKQSGKSMKYGAVVTIKEQKLAKVGISFSLDHPLASNYFNTKRSLVYAKIGETTKNKIRPILKDGLDAGDSVDTIAKELQDSFAFSKNRAIMISSNEIGHAYEEGRYIPAYDAVAEGHKVSKVWQTVRDSRVTEACSEYEEMGWIDLDRDFVSSEGTIDLIAPRTTNPRCRCRTSYKTKFNN